MVRSTRPLHKRWGKLRTGETVWILDLKSTKRVTCVAARLRFSQA